jgi:ribonuclease BN (tRNA processing enzyme)
VAAALFPVRTVPVLDRAFELAFAVHEYAPGDQFMVGGMRLSLHLLRHGAPNCGVRLESAEGTLAYTGDTGVTPDLLTLARGADMLLAEATLTATDPGPHGHLCAADAGRCADQAQVGSLVLPHFPSADPGWLRACRGQGAEAFTGPIHLAQPGSTFDVVPAPV